MCVDRTELIVLHSFTVVGFTLSGVVKVLDFGLAHIVENAAPDSDATYEMSGETGSVRDEIGVR